MRNKISDIRNMQLERMQRFPKNRIAFWKTGVAASSDTRDFESFRKGTITLHMLCGRLAENNFLPYVTEEQALNEAELLGYTSRLNRYED